MPENDRELREGLPMEGRRRFAVAIHPDHEDGGYAASIPSLPGVYGQGETEEEALEDAREALEFTLESMAELGEELPRGDEVVRELAV
jgi:predicted RNase H-like HicB family nuclease